MNQAEIKKLKIAPLILLVIILMNSTGGADSTPDIKKEISAAFTYLNNIRKNPGAYSREIGINLGDIKAIHELQWDERLARSARKRADDMAKRNYFGHVTPEGLGPNYFARLEGYVFPSWWGNSKSSNYIESISAGSNYSGIEHIKNLLYDRGADHARAGHRLHLLGIKKFWASHIHVGIGFAYNPRSRYRGYFVVHTGVPAEKK